ncbi:competence/damage-inducible protein A [Pedobacter chitinilyticus]|uniref:CinA-like protein n=1 Tax=Pedobacter chitinilyticus TaxID=2233776 RepID=A0A443Z0U2_9SPHI|nr:competence/damage-inducible protein A [Pedobacter chitinilyticus]RWU10167.1 competence/damage-inducible protein A [Pedobacter chitinilyticus]
MLAEIITIGDEILIGQIVDTNSAWMAAELNKIGVKVKQITSISDEAQHIVKALEEAQNRADIILITGGLGPTKDDITKLTLAKYFNMPLRLDEETLAHVKEFFDKLNRPMIEVNIKQAEVPDGCTVIKNKNGTAPCMWFEHHGKIIVSMPGVPFEMKYLMEDEIIPRIKERFEMPFIFHQNILTAGLGESFLAEQIADIENALPAYIKLAYLPKLGQVRLRLSASGTNEAQILTDVAYYTKQIVERVEKYVVLTEDLPFEKAVLNLMDKYQLTLSLAESCTGGYVSHLFTQHPGSSSVFQGGAVTYSNDLKQLVLGVSETTLAAYGAVSEQTATEMAQGAVKNFRTDYAVAITGIAGPDGGTPEKPVGMVWIAVASKTEVKAKMFKFASQRFQNIERSAMAALMMLFLQLKQDLNVKH